MIVLKIQNNHFHVSTLNSSKGTQEKNPQQATFESWCGFVSGVGGFFWTGFCFADVAVSHRDD